MMILFLTSLLTIASADIYQQAAPAVHQSVLAFYQGAAKAGTLSEALGYYDPIIDQIGEDLQTEVGGAIHESLKDILQKIKDSVDQGKSISQELLNKVKELRRKIKDLGGEVGGKTKEILQEIKEKAKQVLKHILEKLESGHGNMDDAMDSIARMNFRDLFDIIRDKILSHETIQNIRNYFRDLNIEDKAVNKLKEFIEKLTDNELRDIIRHILEYDKNGAQAPALNGETWDKIKNFFKDINVNIQERSKKFGEWVKNMWGKGMDKMKEKYGTVKAIAMEFIANHKDLSAEIVREALEFFVAHKEELGKLWDMIVESSKESIGKF